MDYFGLQPLSTLAYLSSYPHDVYRNNADLGKGVPRQHVSMRPGNSSFFVHSSLPACLTSLPFCFVPHHNPSLKPLHHGCAHLQVLPSPRFSGSLIMACRL